MLDAIEESLDVPRHGRVRGSGGLIVFLFVVVMVCVVGYFVLSFLDESEPIFLFAGERKAYLRAFDVRPVDVSAGQEEGKLPRLIWFFWDGPVDSFAVQCVASWHKFAPGWEVRGVNFSNLSAYLDASELPSNFMDLDSIQRQSDCVRLALLAKYGGVWVDASVMFNRNLEEWIAGPMEVQSRDGKGKEFLAYYIQSFSGPGPGDEVIESWFLAAKRGSLIIRKWKELFFRELEKHVSNGVGRLEDSEVMKQTDLKNLGPTTYLFIHTCMLHMRQKDEEVQRVFNEGGVQLYKAEDSAFVLIAQGEWASQLVSWPASGLLAHEKAKFGGKPIYMLKIRGNDRPVLERYRVAYTDRHSFPSGTAMELIYKRATQ